MFNKAQVRFLKFANMKLYDLRDMTTRLKALNKHLGQLEELMQYAPPNVKDELIKQFYSTLKETTAQLMELSKRLRKKDNLDIMLELFEQAQELLRISNHSSEIITKLKKQRRKDPQREKLIECIHKVDKEILQIGLELIRELGSLYVITELQKELNGAESKDKKRKK